MHVRRVCVFDVNETLLDLGALDKHFVTIFGNGSLRNAWFAQFLQSAMVSTVTNSYKKFGDLGIAALEMLATRHGVRLVEEHRRLIRHGMQHLPAHQDVRECLDELRRAGIRLATLTNSTEEVAEAQLKNAGIRDYFEQVLSADTVQRLKPASEPYHMAADRLGVSIDRVCLVAAHSWDIAGALRAGCAAAFVARPGMVLDPSFERPDVIGVDLREVSRQILLRDM
ncbi:MAG TPA: haloacid dehalogenase type II [Nitrososphaerales archaeon]|nr:haloacid dehalogenase type II [Nitrososphaerales archaeon]